MGFWDELGKSVGSSIRDSVENNKNSYNKVHNLGLNDKSNEQLVKGAKRAKDKGDIGGLMAYADEINRRKKH